MRKITALLIATCLLTLHSYAQVEQGNVLYIIDSIPVIEDPQPGNDIIESEIADITVIKNKDTLKLLGYEKLDGVIFIFTKEYRNRPAALKQIPSSRQMKEKRMAFGIFVTVLIPVGSLTTITVAERKAKERLKMEKLMVFEKYTFRMEKFC
jgi:hypothetical protein